MKYSAAIAAAAFVAGASATNYTTEVVTAYTTYCPAPTTLTHGGKTYPVTEATTLTITDCPCTITKPVYTAKTVAPYPTANGTVPHVGPTAPAGSVPAGSHPAGSAPVPSATGANPGPSAGAASTLTTSGAALAGVAAIAALLF